MTMGLPFKYAAGTLGFAAVMTCAVLLVVWGYPPALERLVSGWDENAAHETARLAAVGRLDEAEQALERAASRPKAWIDGQGRERQRVYLGRRVWVDHQDFLEASRAFLEAERPAPARRAAREALWRYHSVNRVEQTPELWEALAKACEAYGDVRTARTAAWIARACREGPSILKNDAPYVDLVPNPAHEHDDWTSLPLAAERFRIDPNGRFNPANRFRTFDGHLTFDEPCVAKVDLPTSAPISLLRFEARSRSVHGWPPIVVIELGDQWRLAPISSPTWTSFLIPFTPPARAASLRISYLNHASEHIDEGPSDLNGPSRPVLGRRPGEHGLLRRAVQIRRISLDASP